MTRFACLLVLLAAGCAEPTSDAPARPEPEAPASTGPDPAPDAAPAAPDTLRIDADAPSLAVRPRAPLRIDGACPFEGCQYATWTTTEETRVYAAPDTTSATFTVPAGAELDADRGFVLLTRIGQAVARRAAEVYVGFEDTRPVAAGDTLWVLDYEGEGSFRVWTGGTLAYSDGINLGGVTSDDPPLEVLAEPVPMWWAHVTLADGRDGWLWMDRTPPVEGADALA